MQELMQLGLGLFGGLAIFLYGMGMMSGSLQEAAGERIRGMFSWIHE